MKFKAYPAPRVIAASVAQGRTILRGSWCLFRTNKMFALGVFVGAITLGLLVYPYDMSLRETVYFWGGRNEIVHQIAWYLGTFGDYPTYNVPLALLIWIYGVVTKSSWWRRVGMICFLGASLAGLFDDCFRLTLGRPRPDTHLPDGFYGITYAFSGGYQSFPSGHAAAVFGTASALLVTDLPLGFITTLFALGVVWARVELNRHYPSDVAVGSVIGIYFGLLVGLGSKLRRPVIPKLLDSRASSL